MSRETEIARRALLAGAAVIACAFAAARLVEQRAEEAGGDLPRNIAAMREMLTALPRIVAGRGPIGMVMGASTAATDFSPEEFDARLGERHIRMTSYNLAIASSNPTHLRLLGERIHALSDRDSKRLSLAIIEFPPESATVSFQRHRQILVKRALLTDWRGVAKAFLEKPRTAMELAGIKALGGLGPPEITEQLRRRLRALTAPPADEREIRLRRLVDKLSRRGEPLIGWNEKRRGESRALFPETRKEYEDMIAWETSPKPMAESLAWGKGNDCLELHFSEEMITELIRAVKELQAVSDRTYVLIAPRPNWLAPTPEGRQRLTEAIARVTRETGAETIDLGDSPEFGPADFADLSHLNESTGRPKFAKVLAADVAARWSAANAR